MCVFLLYLFLYSQDLPFLCGAVRLLGRLLRGYATGLLPDSGSVPAEVAKLQRADRHQPR